MDSARPGLALERIGADLGGARVVIALCAPYFLDAPSRAGDVGAGFARVDGNSYLRFIGKVQADFSRFIPHMKGVGGGADEHGRAIVHDRFEPLRRRLAAAGDRQRAQFSRSFPAGPKADEGPEGKCKKNSVVGSHPGGFKDRFPTAGPPLPGLLRIEPVNRFPRGSRGLVDTHVTLDGKRQSAAKGRMGSLILDQFAFGRKGKFAEFSQRSGV